MNESDPVLHIQLLDQQRELPLSDVCCSCQCETRDILDVTVRYISRDNSWLDSLPPIVVALLMPRWLRVLIVASNNASDANGHDQAIGFPVRICGDCIERLPNSKWKWAPLICREPLYANLFKRYPRACVISGFKRSKMRPMSSVG